MGFFRVITKRIEGFFKSIGSQFGAKLSKIKRLPQQLAKSVKEIVRNIFKTLFKRPTSIEDYVKTGSIYISKRALVFLIALIVALVVVVDWFFVPFLQKKLQGDRIYINSEMFHTASGQVAVYNQKDELVYEGQMEDGRITGEGKIYDGDLLVYEGQFLNEMYEGYGKLFQNNQLHFEGDFVKNQFEGKGKLYEAGRLVYEGDFRRGVYEGQGKLYQSELIYEGNFQDGIADGQCVILDSNGTILFQGIVNKGEIKYENYWKETISRLIEIFPSCAIKEVGKKRLFFCDKLGIAFLEGKDDKVDRFFFLGKQKINHFSTMTRLSTVMEEMNQDPYTAYSYQPTNEEQALCNYLGISLEKNTTLFCVKYLINDSFVKGVAKDGVDRLLYYEVGMQ